MTHAVDERAVLFRCEGEELLGIIASSADPAPVGVLIVVGGPQYRVGSHRQFVQLARGLAASGTACMRFDYRGMGDGSGATRSFEAIDADVRVAVDAFFTECPRVASVVLWGLCDGASAICFYAATDPRIAGVVLVNPWVRTEVGEARTYLKHYYVRRLFSRAFWRKLVGGEVNLLGTVKSLLGTWRRAFSGHGGRADTARSAGDSALPLPERMARGLGRFRGRVLVILSGNDYTAQEFRQVRDDSPAWTRVLENAETIELVDADHTFSTRAWKAWVAEKTVQWLSAAPSEPAR
jgi:uncharacterized protein